MYNTCEFSKFNDYLLLSEIKSDSRLKQISSLYEKDETRFEKLLQEKIKEDKKKSQEKYNIPMVHNTNPKSNKHSYIIPKVRNRKLSDLKILNDHILNKKDKKTTDNIYKEHLKNKNRLEKAKKSLKKEVSCRFS